MLKDELAKIDCSKDEVFMEHKIVLFNPTSKKIYNISFGDGSDDEPIDDCDDYLYMTIDQWDKRGMFMEDYDGGNMWFHQKEYTGKINDYQMICHALEFLACPDIDDCIVLNKF